MHNEVGIVVIAAYKSCALTLGQTAYTRLNLLWLAIRLESDSRFDLE